MHIFTQISANRVVCNNEFVNPSILLLAESRKDRVRSKSLQGNPDSSCNQPNRQKYIYPVVVKDILAYHLLISYPNALGHSVP